MAKNNILYLLMLAGLFFAFVSVLDENKAKADDLIDKVSYDVLKYQWVVAEAKDLVTKKDFTDQYGAVMYQFLSSGGFVEFKDKIISNTGVWRVLNNQLEIEYDDSSSTSYRVNMVRAEELILQNGNMQLRLLRLQL